MTTFWPEPADRFDRVAVAEGAPGGVSAEGALRRSRERYGALLRAGALVMWRSDPAGRVLAAAGWHELTGCPDESALDRGFLDRVHPEDRGLLDFRGREPTDVLETDCRVHDREGRWRWVRARGVLLPAADGFEAEWVGTLEDIHDQRRALDRARYLAEHDALTGLGNRRTLAANLVRLRDKQASATVVMLDVDRFKAVNDLYGHQQGDRFLVRLAQMLGAAAPAHSVCARMGGDEFCVVVADRAEARAVCAALEAAASAGVGVGELVIPLTVSAGLADADWDEPDPVSRVLHKADLALRRAKAAGLPLVVHDPQMQAESDLRDRLLSAMGAACRNDEFFLEYQPIVDVDSGRAVSHEALIRWQHPQFGRIEPSLFVRLAEENGMITELGRWVLTRACAEMARLDPSVRVNLNVSARQLAVPGFADEALAIARAHGVAPQRLTLELTESVNMAELAGSDAFAGLRRHGFGTVLDDFGTEYAVLSHIGSGHFDGIKLSRGFIETCGDARPRIVLRHVVNLCRDLGMAVVAEGIETEAERECLRSLGVRLMQGYHFDRPRRVDELPGALRIPA